MAAESESDGLLSEQIADGLDWIIRDVGLFRLGARLLLSLVLRLPAWSSSGAEK